MSIESIAIRYGVTVADILGKSQLRKIVRARHEAMYEMWRDFPDATYKEIGQAFGGRSPQTVSESIQNVIDRKKAGMRG